MTDRRANYALVTFMEHLGEAESRLDVEWAEFVGDETTEATFEVPTDDPTDVIDELADELLRVETGPSEELAKGDYEHELRIVLADEYGESAIDEIFPEHVQSVVRGQRE